MWIWVSLNIEAIDHNGNTFSRHLNSSPPVQNGQHTADDIFKCIFRYATFLFWFQFHCNLFPRVHLEYYSSIGSDNGLAPTRRQTIILTNTDPVHRRIYAALGGDELMLSVNSLGWKNQSGPCTQRTNHNFTRPNGDMCSWNEAVLNKSCHA